MMDWNRSSLWKRVLNATLALSGSGFVIALGIIFSSFITSQAQWLSAPVRQIPRLPTLVTSVEPDPVAELLLPIRLRSRTFTPSSGIEPALQAQMEALPVRWHGLIQLSATPDDTQRLELDQAGVRLLDYIPENAWIASLPADITELQSLPIVHWIGRLLPEDKVHPAIHDGHFGSWAINSDGTVNLQVDVFTEVPLSEARKRVLDHGGTILGTTPEISQLFVRLPAMALWELASEDMVQWIDEEPAPPENENDGVRTNVSANVVQSSPYHLNGTGVQVAMWDGGRVDPTHPDFKDRLTVAESPKPANSEHATHVAGTLAGDGSNSADQGGSPNQWRGVAPGVDIISYVNDNAFAEHRDAINAHGADLSQNSWGPRISTEDGNCDRYGDYDQTSRNFDRIVTGFYGKRIPVVFSAGNERNDRDCNMIPGFVNYTNVPATGQSSKNTIVVGATNSDNDSMTEFSSWGPVDDGRIKPDLVAPGGESVGDNEIWSTLPSKTYGPKFGTSMAAPVVSGSIALILQRYRGICPASGEDPLPSTVKALLVQTTHDLNDGTTWFNRGPDYASGYGRINVKDAIDMIPYHIEASLDNEAIDTYEIIVSHQEAIKVTLAWDDVPAAMNNGGNTLVNDLDLELVAPDDTVHQPWILDPAEPTESAIRGVDNRNVVEQVVVIRPMPGTWTIRVKDTNVRSGPQSYSLVNELLTSSSCEGATTTDVWLRDNVNDKGAEPSKGTMYHSPDIWVRNTLGPGTERTEPGPHQNPEFGQTNYVYAMVRNRSDIPAYDVRAFLYWAKTSSGLAWPQDWHLIGASTVANLNGGHRRIIDPIPWEPPDPGHYCLYARLVTSQDPIQSEGSSPNKNARNNNEIAWKNVNIVDNVPNQESIVGFIVRNTRPEATDIDLKVQVPEEEWTDPFFSHGKVIVDLGPDLFSRCW